MQLNICSRAATRATTETVGAGWLIAVLEIKVISLVRKMR